MACIASLNVSAAFGKKKAAPVKKTAPKKKSAPAKRGASSGARKGNIGPNRTLWNGWESNPEPPAYLDGTLPGDAGFDPFGLSKPVEYLQFDLDALNQSAAINPSGNVIGKLKKVDNKPTERTIVVRFFFPPRGRNPARFYHRVDDDVRARRRRRPRAARKRRALSLSFTRDTPRPARRAAGGRAARGASRDSGSIRPRSTAVPIARFSPRAASGGRFPDRIDRSPVAHPTTHAAPPPTLVSQPQRTTR